MKQIIKQVLQKHGAQQINLGSSAAQSILADEIATELKSNGLYNLYEKIPAREAIDDSEKAKKSWVCQVCGLSTFETEYDYLVHPKLHLGCALKEEMKGKDIKEQYHEASKSYFNDKRKKYIYESPDGGKTIYRREFQKSEREVVEDFQKEINERKNMVENQDSNKLSDRSVEHMKSKYKDFDESDKGEQWSGKYEDFIVKKEKVDERMEENLDWYKNWKRKNFKNEENSTQN